MDRSEAESRFTEANECYLQGEYSRALDILLDLERAFPDNHRIIKAKAQTLFKIGRHQEALHLCDRLLIEFGYEKARLFRDRIASEMGHEDTPARPIPAGPPALPTSDDSPADVEEGEEEPQQPKQRRFQIKPVRLAILVSLIIGMYFGRVPYWLGGGLIVAYFLIKLAMRAAIYRLFTIPFKLKGKALEDATVELHGFEWTEKPATVPDDDEDEEAKKPRAPLRYAWIEVTITPLVRSRGFTHWEPGELMLASANEKFRGLDDLDKCHRILTVKFITDGQEQDDEGYKVHGPQRLKLLAGLPEGETEFKFVYYTEVFGTISLHE
ncbi:MAG: CDC27 family protein [Candidatus Hydrogenedentes bacterium]|nr:CDC27 family protein [Candidatus Hydrogenedentota bacterium]